ncbi:hypothetical protein ALC53_14093 [Atta colombica]|uniref:Uncharacterized protein n=1 Tax=Atta colombica TaxID=520822 RepID=A0A195ATL2_9HYME|nr:hypothetical protein ALC53_14093 [Atta colombica]
MKLLDTRRHRITQTDGALTIALSYRLPLYIWHGIHMYTRLCDGDGGDGDGGGSGGPEGLILSSVIVTGQRHLCEEQTYLAQQAIHQIASLDELSFHKTTGTYSDDKNVDRKSTPRRNEEQSYGKCRAEGALVVARNEHSSLNVLEVFPPKLSWRVSPPSGITSRIYEPFILKMADGETGPEASRGEEL